MTANRGINPPDPGNPRPSGPASWDRRKELLHAPQARMVWEPGEEASEAELAALTELHRSTIQGNAAALARVMEGGTITASIPSQVPDGAAAVLHVSKRAVQNTIEPLTCGNMIAGR
ncbi:hypothetical protein [Streptomyces sp. NPDC059874]|uniref:hypothetical protein n=1 Tax=Streptomyces sp. NPDC059874 TaxID=3346983 RepID=UPI00365A0079